MHRPILAVTAVALLVAAYAIWPLAAAFEIKQAIKAGDVATLQRKVHWEPVRASLKASLAELSSATSFVADQAAAASGQRTPSLWARIKSAAAPIFAERLIDTFVTAEGVTRLKDAKRGAFLSIFGLGPAATADPEGTNVFARFLSFYNRVESARFHSLSEAEFEIADKNNSARRIISRFELSDFEWKLASVRIVGQGF